MELCKEMIKLRELLTEHKIDWRDASVIYPEEKIETLFKSIGQKLGQERQFLTLLFTEHILILMALIIVLLMALALMVDLSHTKIKITAY